MSNIGRILTIKVVIVDEKASEAIWQSMRDGGFTLAAGCKVQAIAEGDLFRERDGLQEQLDAFQKNRRAP